MKSLSIIHVAVIISGLSVPMSAQALLMTVNHPGLAFPENFDKKTRNEIEGVLVSPDITFLGGYAVNWNTTLKYSGSTKSLNLFLQGLSHCAGTIIFISFSDSLPRHEDWHLRHSALEKGGLELSITISTRSKRINLSDLSLPMIHSISKIKQQEDREPGALLKLKAGSQKERDIAPKP